MSSALFCRIIPIYYLLWHRYRFFHSVKQSVQHNNTSVHKGTTSNQKTFQELAVFSIENRQSVLYITFCRVYASKLFGIICKVEDNRNDSLRSSIVVSVIPGMRSLHKLVNLSSVSANAKTSLFRLIVYKCFI